MSFLVCFLFYFILFYYLHQEGSIFTSIQLVMSGIMPKVVKRFSRNHVGTTAMKISFQFWHYPYSKWPNGGHFCYNMLYIHYTEYGRAI